MFILNNDLKFLKSYNQNIYISILKSLYLELGSIEQFLNSIGEGGNFKKIDDLKVYYNKIFTQEIISKHLNFKIEKIYKALYLRNPGPHDKGNSYFHLTLKLNSEQILSLDKFYNSILSNFLKFYKHLFSKIDNYFISLNPEQLEKYNSVLEKIKSSVKKFIDFSDNREIISQRQKLNMQQLSNIPFGGLFYITHINNIESILKHGILSHNLANQMNLAKVDISNQTVNARRNRFESTLGGNIHDFAPLYFNHKNPMLYTLCLHKDKNTLVLLRVNPHILLADNVAFSDGNAATSTTHFFKDITDFNKINWKLIKKGTWYNYEFGKPEGGRIMCSEALVQNKIPTYFINDIFVYSEEAIDRILPLFPNHLGITISVNKNLYF